MPKALSVFCVFFMLVGFVTFTAAIASGTDGVVDEGEAVEELIVPFTEFNGKQVKLVYKPTSNRVELRIEAGSTAFNDDELQFLADTVSKIVASRMLYKLGDSGYTVEFNGEYPIWGPHTLMSRRGIFQCLFFGENVVLDGKTFSVDGQEEEPYYSRYLIEVMQPPDRSVQ